MMMSEIGSFAHQAQANEIITLHRTGHIESQRQSSVIRNIDTNSPEYDAVGNEPRPSQIVNDAKYLITFPMRIDRQDALLLGGVAVGVGGLMVLDEEIRDFVERNHNGTGDSIAEVLTDIGSVEAVFAGNFALLGAGWWFRTDKVGEKLFETAWLSLEAQVFTEVAAGLTKLAVGRSRPTQDREADSYNPFKDFSFDRSFPSSHAARTFAVASVFADRYGQPIPAIAYTTASLISLSRIHDNEHWASDVFAGAVLGFAIGKMLSRHHRHNDQNFRFLPTVPGVDGSVGLTVLYSF